MIKAKMDEEEKVVAGAHLAPGPGEVVFAKTSAAGMTVGIVSDSELSSLALLAGGVAGMAARRARLQKMKQAGLVGPVSSNGQNKEV